MHHLPFAIDRSAPAPLTEQISAGLRNAIRERRLAPGARLPSWQDLATQLGVARGTVRQAYEVLRDEQLIATAGAAGTFVAAQPAPAARSGASHGGAPLAQAFPGRGETATIFRAAIPAQDAFPFKTWSRIMGRAARRAASTALGYPDPRGEIELRAEIAAYLCLARGMDCAADQVFVSNGYAGALNLALQALQLHGRQAWLEDPCHFVARDAIALAGMQALAVPVDAEGLLVADGMRLAPHAALALVTPGQQAPLGVTMSLARRLALLEWAAQSRAWIIEDDYLGELQLQARAAPALASLDRDGRVLHIGTFSKTLNPALRVGYLVAPPELAPRLLQTVAISYPAPAPAVQLAVAEFMRSGLFLRHLRHMKRLYAERRQALGRALDALGEQHVAAGLSVLLKLPDGMRDTDAVRKAQAEGMVPSALSGWFAQPGKAPQGLLLGVTNVPEQRAGEYCARLLKRLA